MTPREPALTSERSLRESSVKRVVRVCSAATVATLLLSILTAGPAVAAATRHAQPTTLKLISTSSNVQVDRYGNDPGMLNLSLFVAAPHGFEVRARRARYDRPIVATRVLRSGSHVTVEPLFERVETFDGLTGFFNITVLSESGATVSSWTAPFCPNSWGRVRVSPSASDRPSYPDDCTAGVWTRGMVWGIDAGWASPVTLGFLPRGLADGTYTAAVTANPAWASALGVDPGEFSQQVAFTLSTIVYQGPGPVKRVAGRPSPRHTRRTPQRPKAARVPGANGRPDLVPLPAWDIKFRVPDFGDGGGDGGGIIIPPVPSPQATGTPTGDPQPEQRDILQFAATVWNAGPSPLVVDGFRRPGQEVMDAYQSFYVKGRRVATKRTGSLVYHQEHQHWHFLDFATHRLLDASGHRVVLGMKEGFCLAPTDAVDLTVPGAGLRPGEIGLGSACGDISALGIREVMPAGWGDTYGAGTQGQEFDVTEVPNGTYYIEVVANPIGSLVERATSNNRSLRRIEIGGTLGARTVTAAPYQGVNA